MKKIVFNTYPRFGLDLGGLQIQVRRTADSLRRLGHGVVYHDQWGDLDQSASILHCFSVDSANLYLALRAKKYGLKVVVSPVLNAFSTRRIVLKAKVAASRLPGVYTGYQIARTLLNIADVIVALNEEEGALLSECFGALPAKLRIIPNGVDDRFFDASPDIFRAQYPSHKDLLLQVSSIEQRKNQLNVARAISLLEKRAEGCGWTYVNIGPTRDGSEAYMNSIRSLGARNVHLLPAIQNDDPLLPSAYAAAKAFILPSFSEVMPLVLYEAAAAGSHLLVSDRVPVDKVLADHVVRFRPDDPDDIAAKISSLRGDSPPKPHELGLSTWMDVAKKIVHHCYD
ncbi:glycosyltransferase family 4 protein [Cupriavidus sp. USMAHM13]|uniref:glycosyltransferase family 4 protein n=1 Tax=Cupriavidus sp. USMAHM13 TaxID=1389192 RepID=UPI0009F557CF|nr:glycosyltransferase family 4 protein [Cupriavidus sp. USMAHM13]